MEPFIRALVAIANLCEDLVRAGCGSERLGKLWRDVLELIPDLESGADIEDFDRRIKMIFLGMIETGFLLALDRRQLISLRRQRQLAQRRGSTPARRPALPPEVVWSLDTHPSRNAAKVESGTRFHN